MRTTLATPAAPQPPQMSGVAAGSGSAFGALTTPPAQLKVMAPRTAVGVCVSRTRSSHATRPGHRRAPSASTRAGPDPDPDEPEPPPGGSTDVRLGVVA